MSEINGMRIKGAFYGSIIGDAIGCTYEFRRPNAIMPEQIIDIDILPINGKPTYDEPLGVWTDDTSMMLGTVEALIPAFGDLNIKIPSIVKDFRTNVKAWIYDGAFTSTGRMFDIGSRTRAATYEWVDGAIYPPETSGAQGNGALMRIWPCALAQSKPTALKLSRVLTAQTHFDPVAVACSHALTSVMYDLLQGVNKVKAIEDGKTAFFEWFDDFFGHSELDLNEDWSNIVRTIHKPHFNGDGWCVETLAACFSIVLEAETVMDGIETAVRLGNDTDTNACIVGTMLGAIHGLTDELWLRQNKIYGVAQANDSFTRLITVLDSKEHL